MRTAIAPFALTLALLFGAGAANAQTQQHSQFGSAGERRLDVRVGTGAPMLLSLSVAGRPVQLPLTIDSGLWAFAFMQGGYLRAGWAFGLADWRDGSARGATIELTPMVGVLTGIAGGDSATSGFAVPEAVVNFDWTWWFSDGFGLGATATLGAIVTAPYADEIDVPLFPDARLAVGVSF